MISKQQTHKQVSEHVHNIAKHTKHNQPVNGEQYFSADPSSDDVRRTMHVTLRGHDLDVTISRGVFSTSRLDLGTSVLLKHAPDPADHGRFFDIGCGWGPIALTLALQSPQAEVFAVDVNERALSLTRDNAQHAGLHNVHVASSDSILAHEQQHPSIDLIWSNPPIRIGKKALHELLLAWLPCLRIGGAAYLVVQKNLGADSLISWLIQALGEAYSVSKYASSKGYRIIEVLRKA